MDGERLELLASIDRHEAALLAYARGLMHWHSRSGFCSVCGHPTRSVAAGHLSTRERRASPSLPKGTGTASKKLASHSPTDAAHAATQSPRSIGPDGA